MESLGNKKDKILVKELNFLNKDDFKEKIIKIN